MGKLKVFEVIFSDEDPLYRAGEWVKGHVRLLLAEPQDAVRGKSVITIRFAFDHRLPTCIIFIFLFLWIGRYL